MNAWQQANLRFKILFITHLVVTVGITAYIALTHQQPMTWIIQQQVKLFDGYYYPKSTFIFTWIAVNLAILPIYLVIIFLKKIFKNIRGDTP